MTPPPIDTARLRNAFASVDDAAPPSGPCPSADEIWAAARGGARPEEAGAVIHHVSACGSCAEAWRLARAVGAGVEGTPLERAPARRRIPPASWWALAAAALLLVTLLPLIRRSPPEMPTSPADLPWRGSEDAELESALSDDARLPREHFVLEWVGPPDARYNVLVSTQDLRVLARGTDVEDEEFRVPPEALSDLPANAPVLWRVEAVLPDGSRLSTPTYIARIE